MPKVIKNTLLKYIPEKFKTESKINDSRIYKPNNLKIKNGIIIYVCEREIRINDNFALQFTLQKSKELNKHFKIIVPLAEYDIKSKNNFIKSQINNSGFYNSDFDFELINKNNLKKKITYINPSIIIKDFNPISDIIYNQKYKIYEIDSHNIIPARYISQKQEYSAATFRRKVYLNIYPFLTEIPKISTLKTEAEIILEDFINNKLNLYEEYKNDINKDVLSGLSKYINLGFISSQKIATEIIKANVSTENKEVFLEELIIRKELAENFCLYSNNYKSINNIPLWAEKSIKKHSKDIRTNIYSIEDLENANTNDILWNATQKQLRCEGKIHGYLRMYWAKKISEWTINQEIAIKYANYLNDKYAYDAPSPNGYVGILWSIAGLHDRAFQDYPITGQIRRMSLNSIKKKFNIYKYIDQYI